MFVLSNNQKYKELRKAGVKVGAYDIWYIGTYMITVSRKCCFTLSLKE